MNYWTQQPGDILKISQLVKFQLIHPIDYMLTHITLITKNPNDIKILDQSLKLHINNEVQCLPITKIFRSFERGYITIDFDSDVQMSQLDSIYYPFVNIQLCVDCAFIDDAYISAKRKDEQVIDPFIGATVWNGHVLLLEHWLPTDIIIQGPLHGIDKIIVQLNGDVCLELEYPELDRCATLNGSQTIIKLSSYMNDLKLIKPVEFYIFQKTGQNRTLLDILSIVSFGHINYDLI